MKTDEPESDNLWWQDAIGNEYERTNES